MYFLNIMLRRCESDFNVSLHVEQVAEIANLLVAYKVKSLGNYYRMRTNFRGT